MTVENAPDLDALYEVLNPHLQAEMESISKISAASKDFLWARWRQGAAIQAYFDANDVKHVDILRMIGVKAGRSLRTMWNIVGFARTYPSMELAGEFIATNPSWTQAIKSLADHTVPTKERNLEKMEQAEASAMQAEEDAENPPSDPDERKQMASSYVQSGIALVASGQVISGVQTEIPEQVIHISATLHNAPDAFWRMFEKILRETRCCVCDREDDVQIAHYPHTRATFPKPYMIVPMCHSCHIHRQHQMGVDTFWAEYGMKILNFYQELFAMLLWSRNGGEDDRHRNS